VIGGGPAGAAAAISARHAGIDVVLVEKSRFPRFRPGESLHPGVEPLLERLGTRHAVLEGDYFRHPGTWIEWGARQGFVPFGEDESGPWLGFQAPRGDFDDRMLSVARDLGVQVRDERATGPAFDGNGRLAGIETAAGRIEAGFVLDASGSEHWLARRLEVPLRRASPRLVARYGYMEGALPPNEPLPRIRVNDHGWTWMADLGRGRYQWTRVTEPARRPAPSWSPPEWAELRGSGSFGADVTWRIAEQTAGEGWFLCGDAGGVLDPSSSHGVMHAVMSGMMAACLAGASITGKMLPAAAAASYQKWFADWFRHDAQIMADAYREAGLFGF
jgi:flavin-dependent dehydrogenase